MSTFCRWLSSHRECKGPRIRRGRVVGRRLGHRSLTTPCQSGNCAHIPLFYAQVLATWTGRVWTGGPEPVLPTLGPTTFGDCEAGPKARWQGGCRSRWSLAPDGCRGLEASLARQGRIRQPPTDTPLKSRDERRRSLPHLRLQHGLSNGTAQLPLP